MSRARGPADGIFPQTLTALPAALMEFIKLGREQREFDIC